MPSRPAVLGLSTAILVACAVWSAPASAELPLASGFAKPPPRSEVILVSPSPVYVAERPPSELPHEDYRSPVRFSLGPAGVSSGHGFGMGLGIAADFGSGTVGARLSAAWLRAESSDPSAPIAGGFGHYAAELNLDLLKSSRIHPLLGVGFGLVHVGAIDGKPGGFAGVGIARIGVEYALGLDDADVRLGLHVTGGLTGPADPEIAGLKGYVLGTAGIGIGF